MSTYVRQKKIPSNRLFFDLRGSSGKDFKGTLGELSKERVIDEKGRIHKDGGG